MSDKTFKQVEIKHEIISCHLVLYFTQDRQGLTSYVVKDLTHIKTNYPYYHKQRSIA